MCIVTSTADIAEPQNSISYLPGGGRAGKEAASAGTILRLLLPRVIVVALILTGVAWVISQNNITVDPSEVWSAVTQVTPYELVMALGLCMISFTAVAFYDVVSLRLFRKAQPPTHVARTGFTAVALGQMLGFGIVVATIARWRHYRAYGLTIATNAAISVFVAVSFLLALTMLVAVSGLISPHAVAAATGWEPGFVMLISTIGLAVGLILLAVCYLQPRLSVAGKALTIPRFHAVRLMLMLTILDVLPAAGILWILLPADSGITFTALLPVFIAALTLGLASNAPAGIGILEVACLLAWPHVDPAELVASLVLFRTVYYILPFLVAAGMMVEFEWRSNVRGLAFPGSEKRRDPFRRADVVEGPVPGVLPREVSTLLKTSSRAEAALARLGDKSFLLSRDRDAFMMFADRGNSLVSLAEPVGSRLGWTQMLHRFEAEARTRMAEPVFYKADSTFAAFLARSGYSISLIGHEAVVRTQSFDLESRPCRELRRKCRQAAKGGLVVAMHPAGTAHCEELKPVSDAWVAAKSGRERGFSMGRFDADYLRNFDILVARTGGRAVGFVSILKSGDGHEWSVDLMRASPDAPPGTMHALIVEAIGAAKAAGAHRLSLCSVAFSQIDCPNSLLEKLSAYFYRTKGAETGLTGLYRFKRSFNPVWEPLYLCARNRVLPVSALVSIHQLVVDPEPV